MAERLPMGKRMVCTASCLFRSAPHPTPETPSALRGSEIDAAAQLTTVIPRRAKPDVGIRFSFTPRYDYTQSQGDADSHDQFENWSRNDRGWVEAGSADFYHALGAPLRGAVTVGD